MAVVGCVDGMQQQGLDPASLRIKALLAKGGFALCYRATYQGDAVAVKIVPRHASDAHSEYCLQAFVHECLLLQGLRHEYDPPWLPSKLAL